MVRGLSLAVILIFQIWLFAVKANADSHLTISPSQSNALGLRQIVLVTSGHCCPVPLTSLQLRKLYLGIVVKVDDCQLRPLRNRVDNRLDALFIQSVMSMTPRTYERELVSGLFREGRPRPEEFTDAKKLMDAFREDSCAVTYLWKQQAERIPDAEKVQVLWEGVMGR